MEGLLAAVYFGDVDETKEVYLKYQLLRLGAGSDEEGPLEAASDGDWGANPMAAVEASRSQEAQGEGAGADRAPNASSQGNGSQILQQSCWDTPP